MKQIKLKIDFYLKNEVAKWYEEEGVKDILILCIEQYAKGLITGSYIQNVKDPKHTKY